MEIDSEDDEIGMGFLLRADYYEETSSKTKEVDPSIKEWAIYLNKPK